MRRCQVLKLDHKHQNKKNVNQTAGIQTESMGRSETSVLSLILSHLVKMFCMHLG